MVLPSMLRREEVRLRRKSRRSQQLPQILKLLDVRCWFLFCCYVLELLSLHPFFVRDEEGCIFISGIYLAQRSKLVYGSKSLQFWNACEFSMLRFPLISEDVGFRKLWSLALLAFLFRWTYQFLPSLFYSFSLFSWILPFRFPCQVSRFPAYGILSD